MAEPGRNMPCPCGSGLKYKRCCDGGFTTADIQAAYKEFRHIVETLDPDEPNRLWEAFRGPKGRPPGPYRPDDDMFIDWMYFDALIGRGRLVDRLLESSALPRGVRAFAAAMRDTAVRLYEVVRVARKPQISLRDVLTGVSYSPRGMVPAGATEDAQLVAARIVHRGVSGQAEFHGGILTFSGHARSELTALLRDELGARRQGDLAPSERDDYKALAPILCRRWCAITFPDRPRVRAPTTSAERREALELELHAQYAGWIDAPNEALGGASPRTVARSPDLLPRLVELLRGLEREYARRLMLDEPAFDPWLLWDDLGLRVLRDGPRDRPPPLGHETMAALVPWISEVAVEIAREHRDDRDQDLEWTLPMDLVFQDPRTQRYLRDHTDRRVREGANPDPMEWEVQALAIHLTLRANFELHLRKVFWVADELSMMLGTTSLEGIDGSALRLPFGCFALVFTDRYTLGLAERLLVQTPVAMLRGRILRVVTAYLHNVVLSGGRPGIRVAFTCDADGATWPVAIVRDFAIGPEMRIVDILASVAPGSDADELAPLWSCVPLRHLLHLVFNAVLHVTSRAGKTEARELDPLPPNSSPALEHERRTAERVFELPGTIDIHVRRAIQQARSGAVSGEQIQRCLVRGYRRRANPGWKDQEERWIKPYWRGPDDGPIVERHYRILP